MTNSGINSGVYILQYAPESYDLQQFVATQGQCDFWDLTRAPSSMRVGDRVYILRVNGFEPTGRELAGIVAIGRLMSPIYVAPVSLDRASQSDIKRVDVWFEAQVIPTLTREEMRQNSVLKDNVGLCRGIAGSDFAIHSQAEADELESLTTPRLRTFTLPPQPILPDTVQDARRRIIKSIVQRQGQPEFRRKLLVAYNFHCAVTDYDAPVALEAAHISPYRGPHTNDVTNGLLLRADIHTLFDLGRLAIDTSTMTVVLAPELKNTTYADLAGSSLHLPNDARSHPDKAALDEHRRFCGL